MPSGSRLNNRLGEALSRGANEIRVCIVNLFNHRYGMTAKSGFPGPVRLVGYR